MIVQKYHDPASEETLSTHNSLKGNTPNDQETFPRGHCLPKFQCHTVVRKAFDTGIFG